MATEILVPTLTPTNVQWLGVPNIPPNTHLNLDAMTWPTNFDEKEYVRSTGQTAVFRMNLNDPPANRTWIKLTMRMAFARETQIDPGFAALKMTLFISGLPEEVGIFATDIFAVDDIVGQEFSFIVNYTSAKLNSAQLQVEHVGPYIGDMRVTAIELFLAKELFSNTGSGGARGGGTAEITQPVFTHHVLGGALAGGIADVTLFDIVEVGGGALAGGRALAGKLFAEQVAGGALVGGLADQTITFQPSLTGGLLAGGIGDPDFIDQVEVSGGALAGGVASVTSFDIVEVGGGVVIGGEGTVIPFEEKGHGGALTGGAAIVKPYIEIPSGGALAGGLTFSVFSNVGAGGALTGGLAVDTMPVVNLQGGGGALAGGTAHVRKFLPFSGVLDDHCPCNLITEIPLGGALVGGTAQVSGGTIVATGGAICTGFAFVDLVQDPWDGIESVHGLYQDSTGETDGFIDEGSHNFHGTGGAGDATLTPSIDDGVFCLDSQLFEGRHFIQLPRDGMTVDQGFTVSCWAKISDFGQDRSFFTIADDENDWRFTMGYSFANSIRALIQTTTDEFMAWSINFLEMDVWYHFSAVWKPGTSLTVYVNGVLQATELITDTTLIAGGSFNKIGSFRDAGFPLANIMDVRLHPEPKTADWLKAEHDNFCDRTFFTWDNAETLGASVSVS